MICPICQNLLRVNGTRKAATVLEDKVKVILYQTFTCMNHKSMDNAGNPCPNFGNIVDTVQSEEIIDME